MIMRDVLDALELLRVLSIEDQVAFEVVDLEVRIRARARAAVVIERIVAVSRIQRLETPPPRQSGPVRTKKGAAAPFSTVRKRFRLNASSRRIGGRIFC